MKEMVGGCCVCSDDRGWAENPLVYCDGPGCTVAVHQACYGIVTVPLGNWYCRKCETEDNTIEVFCELCPNREGALKPTDNDAWAHVVCALYIPEVRFGNVTTMEPIILAQIPQERYNKTCYICEEANRGSSRSTVGACMQCNKAGCKQQFHVTCAQRDGLLCEEAGNYMDNVKYCGYCHHHYTKLSMLGKQKKGGNVKSVPPYRPIGNDSPETTPPNKDPEPTKTTSKRKLSTGSTKGNKTNATNQDDQTNQEDNLKEPPAPLPHNVTQEKTSNLKRKKGGSRTPPTTGPALSPDASPRPITPQNPTAVSQLSSMNPVVALTGISIPSMSGSVSTTTITSTLPGQVSAAALVASTPSGGSSGPSSVVEAKRPSQSVLKETRPNSIVVNVPLEVALPNAAPSVPPVPTASPVLVAEPISPVGSNSTLMEVTPVQSQPHPPVKRVRSQSSEKSDKSLSRRSSKRSSGSSSSNSAIVIGNSGKMSNHMSLKNESHSHHSSSHNSHSIHHSSSNHHSSSILTHESRNEKKKITSGLNISTTSNHVPPVSAIKEEKDIKILASNAPHMLGNTLNPASSMAQKMCDTLSQEVVAHSIFSTSDHCGNLHLVGPQRSVSNVNTTPSSAGSNNSFWSNNSIPQTLEQLLERQWEQGSQFLMEQAQHFDIASLLSCLHQLRAENAQLEEHVATLVARRDQLLAVNARLAIPFTTGLLIPTTNTMTNTTNSQVNLPNAQPVENGISISSPHTQEFRSITRTQGNGQNSITYQCTAQNSVLVRTNSTDVTRRSSQSPASGVFNSTSVTQHQSQSQMIRRSGESASSDGQHHSQSSRQHNSNS
ncbi:protein AF-10 isoform X2 [Cimex lectularius]|uniref:Protein AF-10 n=1 Tax=Cimex lectularius TaxID=79782 RepID=A0A8I6S6X0_CIMLE|nr:protein AF-10 isoform X2 [Cimex lectularius]